MLDDKENSGSKAWMITADVELPPFGRLLFPSDITNLSLSNSGDEVRLLYPSGAVADQMVFSSMKKGRAIAWNTLTNTTCLTDSVTPLLSNTCFIQNKKNTQKKSEKKKPNKKQIVLKNNPKLLTTTLTKSEKSNTGLYRQLQAQIGSAGSLTAAFSDSMRMQDVLTIFLCVLSGILAYFFIRKKK